MVGAREDGVKRYLLLTHIPAVATRDPGVIRWPAKWVQHLAAQADALSDAGFGVTVATPLLSGADPKPDYADCVLANQRYTFAPVDGYRTMAQYMTRRNAVRRWIDSLAREADIVQLGVGGHPVALGQVAWPVVSKTPAKRLLVFSSDPIPGKVRHAASGRNPAKRLAKNVSAQRLERFCAGAIRDADLVFAHDDAVARRFAADWSDRCHTFFASPLRETELGAVRTCSASNPVRIVCVGTALATRGVDHLLRAVGKARRLSARVELDLVGDLIESAELMNLVREEKLESVLRLHGRLSDAQIRAVLDAADLYVSPSLIPAFDPIIYLACGRGLPIVTYESDAATDQRLREAGAGLVIPRGEAALLAQAILDLATGRARLGAMSERAMAWARATSLDAIHRERARLARSVVMS